MRFKLFKTKQTGTKYRFNDYPFNSMNWTQSNAIEAIFNVGNPKNGDVIEFHSKKFGKQNFIITHLEFKNPMYFLIVRQIVNEY